MADDLAKRVGLTRGKCTQVVLKGLGIPYRKGQAFWHLNQDQLEYLYVDFLKAAKQRKKELHPDVEGGDSTRFQEFSETCEMVKRQFEKHLPLTQEVILTRMQEAQDYAVRDAQRRAAMRKRHK